MKLIEARFSGLAENEIIYFKKCCKDKKSQKVLKVINNIPVTVHSIKKLRKSEWLNDEVIVLNQYLLLLTILLLIVFRM